MPDHSDVDPEHRYHRVLSVIDHQSSPVQRPGVRPETINLTLSAHGPYTPDGVRSSLQAVLDNDDAIVYRDQSGDIRFALPREDKIKRLVDAYPEIANEQRIREVLD
jgi:hypothetical protein